MPKLSSEWSVEELGLIDAVAFRRRGSTTTLMWCDGEWTMSRGLGAIPASGVPRASTSREARRVGTQWINEVERDA